ncbi:MAG: hypothetical protein J5671_02880 [Bacteroidaceae bacterium]|nr:hypothetical protein [Bacteroidaceae bacterium]
MKKTYIAPALFVTPVAPGCVIAESLPKGMGDFDSGSMKFVRQDRDWDIWGEASNDEDWEDDY